MQDIIERLRDRNQNLCFIGGSKGALELAHRLEQLVSERDTYRTANKALAQRHLELRGELMVPAPGKKPQALSKTSE